MSDQNKQTNKEKLLHTKGAAPAPPPVRTVSRQTADAKQATAQSAAVSKQATAQIPVASKQDGASTAGLSQQGTAQMPAAAKQATASMPAAPKHTAAQSTAATPPQKQEKRKHKHDSEQMRLKKEEQARRARRRNRQLIGLAVAILVVVGAVSIVTNGIEMARNMFDNSDEIEMYQNRFKGFVWFDILPFDSVSNVDENSIKQVILWSIFDDQSSQLQRNEDDQILIPASEVDRYAAEIFGPDFRFSGHAGFQDQLFDLTYQYDPDTLMYAMPATSLNNNFLPRVMKVEREPGGIRRVIMGYVSAISSENQVLTTPDYDHPVRYMDFMLRRDGNGYYLYAIQKNDTFKLEEDSTTQSVSLPAAQDEIDISLPEPGLEDPILSDGPTPSAPAEGVPDESQPQDSSTA